MSVSTVPIKAVLQENNSCGLPVGTLCRVKGFGKQALEGKVAAYGIVMKKYFKSGTYSIMHSF